MHNLRFWGVGSLKKRYFSKLFSSFFGFLFNLASQAIIPRGLGPEAYGNYSFLTNFFTQLTGFVDTGTSTCFYTKLSQRPKEQGLVSFYFIFMGITFALAVICVISLVVFNIYPAIWPDQEVSFIYLALGLGFLMWFAQVISQMADAYGLTVSAEALKILQKFISLLILTVIFITHFLNLENFFLYNYLIWVIFVLMILIPITKNGNLLKDKFRISVEKTKEYINEFWRYSHPLFTYSLVVLLASIFDRWFLQIFAGSVQQGFYSLSYQVGAICFLFTGAMIPLFMRELSIAHGNNDLEKMQKMYRRYMPILFTVTAYFSCFIAVEAEKVVYIFGGARFSGAAIAVAIMAFYPIHQTYGQLSSSVFFATAQTRIYRNIGILIISLGLPITYFMIAPVNKMGINAGAVGLAIKMVVLNIIGVNVQIYYNSKQLRFNYWKYLGHQIATVGILLFLAIVVNLAVDLLLKSNGKVVTFFIAGILYSILVMIVIYFFPLILGIRRKDLDVFIRECGKRLNFGFNY